MFGWKLLLVKFVTALALSSAKIIIVFQESFEQCVDAKNKAGIFDTSGIEIIAEDDTHAYLNGTWKITRDLVAPWAYVMYTERYDRGQWNVFAFNKRFKDFCAEIHNPTEPWYRIYKDVPGCPSAAGTEWLFDMVLLDFAIPLPPTLIGKWRVINLGEFLIDGVMKKECTIINFELVDKR